MKYLWMVMLAIPMIIWFCYSIYDLIRSFKNCKERFEYCVSLIDIWDCYSQELEDTTITFLVFVVAALFGCSLLMFLHSKGVI